MNLHLKSRILPILLNFAAVGIALFTILAVVGYAGLMIVWMHAPVMPVIGVAAIVAFPFALLSWGALALATRISGVQE